MSALHACRHTHTNDRSAGRSRIVGAVLLLMALGAAEAASPPALINYQGVLRDAAGAPLDGAYDMTFRFFTAASGGDEIIVESHEATGGSGAVEATGGIFNVVLGFGIRSDGSGVLPGDPYLNFDEVFSDFSFVYMEIQVRPAASAQAYETLAPRVRINSAPFALNASRVGGKFADEFLDTSSTAQTKTGSLTVMQTQINGGAITFNGGPFLSGGPTSLSVSSPADVEVSGGTFPTTSGIRATGNGGSTLLFSSNGIVEFRDSSLIPQTTLGYFNSPLNRFWTGLNLFVEGNRFDLGGVAGVSTGAFMQRFGGTTTLQSGEVSTDILRLSGGGNGGRIDVTGDGAVTIAPKTGQLDVVDATTLALNASVSSQGELYIRGPIDTDSGDIISSDGTVNFLSTKVGIGALQDINSTPDPTNTPTHILTIAGTDADVLRLTGPGGFGSGARIDFGDLHRVVVFEDIDDSLQISSFGRTALMGGNVGVGTLTPSQKLHVAGNAQVTGNFTATGTKNFVQNHPYRPDLSIVYTALEGDEAGTYTRGSARLSGGEARVALSETFALVTHPDLGLTAHVTPRGEWADLYVASVGTGELIVRSRDGSDAAFDYVVHGLRIGYERFSVLQDRQVDARVPEAGYYDELYRDHADWLPVSAASRFAAMERQIHGRDVVDSIEAEALMRAIGRTNPDHSLGTPPAGTAKIGGAGRPALDAIRTASDETRSGRRDGDPAAAAGLPAGPVGPAVRAVSFHPSSADLASLVRVAGPVEAGDLLVIDPEHPGVLSLSSREHDHRLFGVVAADPGLLLGAREQAAAGSPGPDGAPAREDGAGAPDTHRASVEVPVAVSGVVLCKADAGYGGIVPGDLLTSSPTPGHAMRTDDPLPGTVLGKALEPLEAGTGVIRILVTQR